MSLYIPRLRRAVSDFLQLPLQDTTIAFEIIQESLHDARTVNSVYHLLVSQASREPFSPFLVEKSVAFMRRHLYGFPPSQETLASISRFCVFALKTFGTGAVHARPALERALHFLQTLVDRLITDSQTLSSSSQYSSDEQPMSSQHFCYLCMDVCVGNRSLKPSTLSSVRSWELGMNGMPESENGELNSLGQTSRTASACLAVPVNSLGGVSNASMDNLSQTVRRTKTPVGTPVTPARRADSVPRATYMNSVGSGAQGDSQTHRRSRSGSLAEQFVQEMLRFRPPLIWMPNGAVHNSVSTALQLWHVVVDGNRNVTDGEDDSWQSATSMRGLMCTDHLWTVSDRQIGSTSNDSRRGGSNVLGSGPLFQYRNYEQQESLKLSSRDIAMLVDTVCPSETNQEDAIWGGMDWHEIWNGDGNGSKCIGEACVAILIKFIMDMYLEHGPGISYVLVLQMLHQALLNADVTARVRVFDLIYNLSLHSLMMSNTPDNAFFDETEAQRPLEPTRSRRYSGDMSSPERVDTKKLDTLKEETEGSSHFNKTEMEVSISPFVFQTKPGCFLQDPMLYMMPWVRSLLFDLMAILEQLDEKDDSVWSAAVACFFHLTTATGEFMLAVVHNVPASVISRMLRVCIHAGWADEIYSHLLKLLIKLLYLPHTFGYEGRVVNDCRLSQCGGIEEILYHLRTTRSMLDASLLVQLVIDHVSYKTNCSPDAMGTMLSHLLSASAMDVIVARCRHGEKGIGDILQVALQNCIIERNVIHDSPKKPFHHRYKSHSSFLSSETAMSIQPGVDPRGLESWTMILTEIDELLCQSTLLTALPSRAKQLGNPLQATPASWRMAKELVTSAVHEDRMLGMRWIRDYSLTKVEQILQQEDRSNMSLLPEPPSFEPGVNVASAEDEEEGPKDLPWLLHGWASQTDEWTAVEASQFIDELVSRLTTHDFTTEPSTSSAAELPARTIVHRLSTILFRTLHTFLHWIRLLPYTSRRRPLLTLSFQVCQIVHAPHVITDISASPPAEGLASLPGPFVYNDYILGTASIYIRLLRLAPIEFLLDLISDLRQLCPEYHNGIGFHGRPGHKGESKGGGMANVPWTDTVSDIRAALVLLLLHRCSMDYKGKERLEELCTSLRLDDDTRVRYVASRHMLKYMMETKADECRLALREFVAKAQQMNNEQLVDNPYLQVEHIVESQKTTEQPVADRLTD